jgi:hypothetical protein
MSKGTGRKLDFAERALRTVERAIGEHLDGAALDPPDQDQRNPRAVAIGTEGGKKGGPARAKKLSPDERQKIAQGAARARWATRKVKRRGPEKHGSEHSDA